LFGRKGKQLAFTVTKQPGSTSHESDLVASFTEKLKATDYQVARRKLADFKRDLERTDARLSNTSLNGVSSSLALDGLGNSPDNEIELME
jgi:hypothetical protein